MASEASSVSHADKTSTSFRTKRSIWTIRAIWVVLFGFGIGLAVFSYIAIFQDLDHPALHSSNPFLFSLSIEQWPLLLYFRILQLIVFLIIGLIALFIFWIRSHDWMAILASMAIFYQAMAFLVPSESASVFWSGIIFVVGNIPLLLLAFVFPTGRISPRLARPFVPVLILFVMLATAYRVWWVSVEEHQSIVLYTNLVLISAFGCAMASQLYRYMRVSSPAQRQQTKWLVYGSLLGFSLRGMFTILPQAFPQFVTPIDNPAALVSGIIMSSVAMIALCILPISLAFSVLRYRLWDIDLVINRSLVYASVIALFFLLFFALVAGLQIVLGQTQPITALITTSIIAALVFHSLKKRIQHFVDRRIYGFNFDLYQLRAAQETPEIRNAGALTGKQLGQYEVLDFIGKGGMGEVYKGFANGKTVALKTLAGALALERDYLQRFQREAEVMRLIEHPKIARFYEAGESEGLPYLALEFIEGMELKDYLHEQGSLGFEDAQAILRDIAEALDYLHSKAIVHRDIKPSNVMLRGDDPQEAILMDFGIAKLEDGTTRLTGSNVIGTIDYMSPEQIMAAKEVDLRADVYALGVMAYEMLTGERPFKGSAAQVMFAHLQQPVTDPRDIRPDLSDNTALAILRALQKQPEDRFESAGAFVGALA